MEHTSISSREPSPNRSAGILLHPTSLPGRFGIGDLGPAAYAWVDLLAHAGQKWWQMLPLGPTGYADSPYQSLSAFAGNTILISPELLVDVGLLNQGDLSETQFSNDHVDFGPVIKWKNQLLAKAWHHFETGRAGHLRHDFDTFCQRHHSAWLEEFAVFSALKESHDLKSWLEWPDEEKLREPTALVEAKEKLSDSIGRHRFLQFLFFFQWKHLKDYANGKGIRLIGDVPIFVSGDSADVWARPELFLLDDERRPTVVAGVPPDYFSATGQLWGNPLYNWMRSRQTGHAWWIARMRWALELVDLVRIDHFRGFEAYWEIPASAPTAETGHWVKGPGLEFFHTLRAALGKLPLIAEDLGVITPEVEALRSQLVLPGMRVLQFAFSDDARNPFLPHNYLRNQFVYTGTHDNDTTLGWYHAREPWERENLHRYAPSTRHDVAHELMRMAWACVADYAIAPLQDLLVLGTEARMNLPGQPSGYWTWRVRGEQLTREIVEWLRELTLTYGR